MVGDGHAMGVAAEIVEHMLGAAERCVWRRPPSLCGTVVVSQAAKIFGWARSVSSP